MPEPISAERISPPTPGPYQEAIAKLPKSDQEIDQTTLERQNQILNHLPDLDTLAQRLWGHLQTLYKEGNLQVDQEDREASKVAGELAEILTKTEYDLFPLTIDGVEMAQASAADREIAENLLGVLHNPDILIPDSKTYRNPDLAWLDVNERTVRIIGEVKTTWRLDRRCYQQLKSDGFISTVRGTIRYLNAHPEYGKQVFGVDAAGKAQKGGVTDDVQEIVFMPRDTNLSEENWPNLLKTSGDRSLTVDEANKFIALFKSGQVKLVHFSFSHDEVRVLTDLVMEKIRTKYSPKKDQGK